MYFNELERERKEKFIELQTIICIVFGLLENGGKKNPKTNDVHH